MVVTCFHRVSRPNVLNHIYRATVTEYVAGSHSNALSAQQFYSYRPDPPDKLVSCCVCYWWPICAMMLPTSRERQKRFPCRRRKDWWRTNPTDISLTFFFIVCIPFLAFSYLTVYSTFSSLAHRWIDAENKNNEYFLHAMRIYLEVVRITVGQIKTIGQSRIFKKNLGCINLQI